MSRAVVRRLAALAVLSLAATVIRADDPCSAFTWDATRERTLFGAEPQSLTAGHDVTSAPDLTLDRLYQLSLTVQTNVAFVVPPGKKARPEGALAGLARLTLY